MLLTLALSVQIVSPALASVIHEQNGNITIVDADRNEKGTLTLYRLGGTECRADALVVLVPATAQIEEDRMSYANAAGTNDYRVTVSLR